MTIQTVADGMYIGTTKTECFADPSGFLQK